MNRVIVENINDLATSSTTDLTNVESNIVVVNSSLSNINASLNNVESNIAIINNKLYDYRFFDLRYMRRIGRCYSASIQAWDETGVLNIGFIENPPFSGKRVYIYQISFGNYKSADNVIDRVSLDIRGASSISFSGGVQSQTVNLRLDANTTTSSVCNVYGINDGSIALSFTDRGLIESHGINGNGADVELNFQSEYIEVAEGYGLVFQGFADGSSSININLRWFEVDLTEVINLENLYPA